MQSSFPLLAQYWSYAVSSHFLLHFIFLIGRYCVQCIVRKQQQRRDNEQQEEKSKNIGINMEKPSEHLLVCSSLIEKEEEKERQLDKVYLYGTDLRHLCW